MSRSQMTQPHGAHYTFAQFVELEQLASTKHEFCDGRIYAMAGGTPQHAALAANVSGELRTALGRHGCQVFSSDLAIRVRETGLATYPDVTVVCGPWETDPESDRHVVNPTILVEVTSPSSEEYDRSEKRDHYLTIPSLRAYVVVSHREPLITAYVRESADEPWASREARVHEELTLPGKSGGLDVDMVYRGVSL